MSESPPSVLPLLGLEFGYVGTVPELVGDTRRGLYVLATRSGILGRELVPCYVGSAIGHDGFAGELRPDHPTLMLATARNRAVHIYTCPLVDSDLVVLSIERRLLRELRPIWNRQDQQTAA